MTTHNWINVNEEEVKQEVETQVRKYLELNGNVFGWYILPDELRPWRKNELDFLKIVSKKIHEFDRHPIITYSPFNRDCHGLLNLANNGLDFIGKNAYLLFESKEDRLKIIESMKSSQEAFSLFKNEGKTTETTRVGIYLHLAMDPTIESEDSLIGSLARHDIFLSVTWGAQFIIIWSLFKRVSVRRTYDKQYKAYVDSMKEINDTLINFREKTFTLADIFLNFPKKIELKEKITLAEYSIDSSLKLEVKINSSNLQQALDDVTLEPFQVKYNFVDLTSS